MRAVYAAVVVVLCLLVVWLAWIPNTVAHQLANAGWFLYMAPGQSRAGLDSSLQLRILDNGMMYAPSYTCGHGASAARFAPTVVVDHLERTCPPALPAWVNTKTGEVRTGVQSAAELEQMVRAAQAA